MNRWEAEDWLKPVNYTYEYNPSLGFTNWEATILGQSRHVRATIYARTKKSLDKKVIKLIDKKRKMARKVLDRSGSETIS